MEFTRANWEPLKLHLGVTCAAANCQDENCPMDLWMWMYHKDGVEYYKNRNTREYLRLPTEDRPY